MSVSGQMTIGGRKFTGVGPGFRAVDPATTLPLEPEFASAAREDVARACALADEAFLTFSCSPAQRRVELLTAIGDLLQDRAPQIVARAMEETGLPRPRLDGELARTTNQLRLFAQILRDGGYLDIRIDPALPERTPPRPDLRMFMAPLGPVAIFGASNFPLAFSTAGGDTASALAAGCPVIVKAHPSHPGTAELVGDAVADALARCGLPPGVFAQLFDAGHEIGAALVADSRIQAVGFTGSRRGGRALVAISQARPQPIPVYAEMSSVNPVLLLPDALKSRGATIGANFAAALTLGAGQFCTNPGLLLAIDGAGLESFVNGASESLSQTCGATMLNRGIYDAYRHGVEKLRAHSAVALLVEGPRSGGWVSTPSLFATSAKDFIKDTSLHDEVFGASALLVRCAGVEEMRAVLAAIEGQLTIAIHAESAADKTLAGNLLPLIVRKAGRIIFNGFGTGVEVCDAMVHGGPSPATSDSRTTSVGTLAIERFLRPICYQDAPEELLPLELRSGSSG